MKVSLVAKTTLDLDAVMGDTPYQLHDLEESTDADQLGELAGRSCYESWGRPNPKTATNEGYVRHILEVGHESVLAHASATFLVEGVSRSLTHELIRSRFLAYSELSQRYVNMSDYHVVVPPAIRDLPTPFNEELIEDIMLAEDAAKEAYQTLVHKLEDQGLNRKQAREAARCVLPGGMETKIVVTGNLRAYRDMIKQRWSVHADAEIREFAGEILRQLRVIAPNSFQDIPEEPYGTTENAT